MHNYKNEYKNNMKIIHNYCLYLKKCIKDNKDINKFNLLLLSSIDILNYKVKKYKYDENLYNDIKNIIKSMDYNVTFAKLTREIMSYQSNKYLKYNDIKYLKDMIYIIYISELITIFDQNYNDLIAYNIRKERKFLYIKNSLGNILNINIEELYNNLNLCDIELLKNDEFKNISQEDREVYRNNIIKGSIKKNISEIELINNIKESGKYYSNELINKTNYTRIYIISTIILLICFILVNLIHHNISILILSILVFKMLEDIIHILKKKRYIPKININYDEKLLCAYYKKISNSDRLIELFDDIENKAKDNKYDYALYIECSECDHQIEPFDNEISEMGMKLCDNLNNKYNCNRFHFIYRKRNKDIQSNTWRGFDLYNGCLKDLYDLINNLLNKNERDNLFSSYTNNFKKYGYIMIYENDKEYLNLLNNFGILIHPYNSEYKSITYGNNFYYDSFLYNSAIMRNEDIEYARGTNGLIVKKSLSVGNKLRSIENEYKNSFRILINKRNTNTIEYINVVKNVLSILYDITLLTSITLVLSNYFPNYYLFIFILLSINYIYKLPINIYYKLKVIICYILCKKYRYNKLELYMNNKYIIPYIIYSIFILICGIINEINLLYLLILIIITDLYIIKIINNNRRYTND